MVTVYGLNKVHCSIGMSIVILSDIDIQVVTGACAVVVEKLQTLVSSFRVKNPALQQSRVPSFGCASVEVHEKART